MCLCIKCLVHTSHNNIMLALFNTDPEEFLNMLFKHTLQVEPFIRIRWVPIIIYNVCVYMFIVSLSYRRPFGTEQEYFLWLFLEYDDSMKLPTVGDLLTKMFKEQKISFTEVQ